MSGGIGTAVHVPSFAAGDGRRAVETRYVDGLPQIVAWDLTTGQRRQATTAPLGVETAAIEPDGHGLWWFDAAAGGQGRWQRGPFEGGHPRPALDGVPAGRMHGLAFDPRSGLAAVGVGVEDRSRHYLGRPGERARLVAEEPGYAAVVGLAPGGRLLATAGCPAGPAAVRLWSPASGALVDAIPGAAGDGDGGAVWALGFRPDLTTARPELLLVLERAGRYTLAFWRQGEGIRTHGPGSALDFDTEITACWYGPGRTALVQQDRAGRSRLLRADLDRGTTTVLPTPEGTIIDFSCAPDGTVHCLWSRDGELPRPLTCHPEPPKRPHRSDRSDRSTTAPRVTAPGGTTGSGRRELWTPRPYGQIHSFVATPPGRRTGHRPWPTVFLVHGGPHTHDRDTYDGRTEALVRAGFAVVRTNYRGSTGYGPRWRDDFGHRVGLAQLEDLAAVRGHLIDAGVAEPGRTGLCGYSWGGYLTLLAMGVQPRLWDVGLAVAPVADYTAAYRATTPALREVDDRLFGGTPEQVPHRYRAACPMTYVGRVRGPLFLAASADDEKCPPEQIERYLAALRRHDVPHRVRWLGGGHDVGRDPVGYAAAWSAMVRYADDTLRTSPRTADHRNSGWTGSHHPVHHTEAAEETEERSIP
ncbi:MULTISPECIES: prolyl oligopeptidase family serine peptidase [unclassified Streptomyces]|uniref:prolyl oligopeptidase family serine peptidase n=1 Tax=unclassified Streptomyces TaxID=2593676 RepID=UPI0004C829D3|nr:prolyl oligopeptidase family serine peptidase [Streptomyces sp. NRRL F-2747]